MRDPSRKKERQTSLLNIHWIYFTVVKKITHMVKQHYYHYNAAQYINITFTLR